MKDEPRSDWLFDLHPDLSEVLTEMGLDKATPAQTALKRPLLAGKHCLLIAPTGLGKTEAAMVPLFHRLLTGASDTQIDQARAKEAVKPEEAKEAGDANPLDEVTGNAWSSSPRLEPYQPFTALYITPLRALNRDMLRRLGELGEKLNIKVGVRHGDTSQAERNRQVKDPPQILITTPETLQIMLSGKRLRQHLINVRFVVVDEVHELAESQRGAQLAVGLERLVLLAGEFQRIGLSATVGMPSTVAAFLGGQGRQVDIVAPPLARKTDLLVESPEPGEQDLRLSLELFWDPERIACLRYCAQQVEEAGPTLLFVNTRDTAEALGVRWQLWRPGSRSDASGDEPKVAVHHGSLAKQVRVETEQAYKNGELQGIISTSSLELGIDVGNTQLVLQYNSPRDPSRLIQRLGRAGHRMGLVARGRLVAAEADELLEGAVVARRTLAVELEPSRVRPQPLAVVANQLLSWVVCDGEVSFDMALATFRRAYPFRGLDKETLMIVIHQLDSQWQLNWDPDEGYLKRKKRSRTYFYDNISMIPDEVSYKVIETSARKTIGRLDERFVLGLALGDRIVFRGAPWEVLEVTEQDVTVVPISDIGTLPRWVGEDIPVPWSVAQEVGRLRASGDLSNYPLAPSAFKVIEAYLREQAQAGEVPSHRLLTVERHDLVLVLHCCGGTRVNATLGMLLSAMLAQRLGGAVGFQSDAYRVVLEVGRRLRPGQLIDLVSDLQPEAVEPLIRLALRSSLALRLNLLTIARKFGAVEKGANMAHWGLKRLVEAYQGTLLWEEAVTTVLFRQLDVERTASLVRDLNTGRLQMVASKPTPMGSAGLRPYKDALKPPKPDRAIRAAVHRRLLNRPLLLCCLNCGNRRRRRASDFAASYELETRDDVDEVPDEGSKEGLISDASPDDADDPRVPGEQQLRCPGCGGQMVAALPVEGQLSEPLRKMVARMGKGKARVKTPADRKLVERLHANAYLVNEFGPMALLALAARGVGESVGSRILARQHESLDSLLVDLIGAEINYARTRQWWD